MKHKNLVTIGLAVFMSMSGPGGSARAQVVVLNTIENHGGWAHINVYAPMAAWTQTATYSGLNIAAMLNGGDATTTGTFYLMDQVGRGTTTAHELARASFSITGSSFRPELVTIFDGLTLGPGTYYLVAGGSGPGGWETTTGPQAVFTAPDVSLAVNHFSAQIYDPYPPANAFYNAAYNRPDYNLEFVISVPEPASAALFLFSSLTFLIFTSAPPRARGSSAARRK